MKIRSITCFFDPSVRPELTLERFTKLIQTATRRFNDAGIEVQTCRLVTTPLTGFHWVRNVEEALTYAVELEKIASSHGFNYLSLGPVTPTFPDHYSMVVPILTATRNVFLTGIMAGQHWGISLPAVRACGEIIAQASTVTPDGFTNLRFAALANVPPFIPFFPSAYSEDSQPCFAIAVECADLAVSTFQAAQTISEARQQLIAALEEASGRMEAIITGLVCESGLDFKGFDFSLAPYPVDECSLGGALEELGVAKIGLCGSLASAAFTADTLDRGSWPRTGFNGLMLPVLEDSVMAMRSTNGGLTIKDLLLFSAVCGIGLDTVPLPGDSTAEQLSALLLDVAALAMRLNKPLTARLMPVPGKSAGDPTGFNFSFFANGTVLDLPAAPLSSFFASNDNIEIHPRPGSTTRNSYA